jgi:hypothetical protein
MFNNMIDDLSQSMTLPKLVHLRILNLNHNNISNLPATIGQLIHLEIFSIEHNQLCQLPNEIGLCRQLLELHLGYNCLSRLPLEIGYLTRLTRLIVHRNRLVELPESLTHLKASLTHLDVACNHLRIFPSRFHTLKLTEFYAERNALVERAPIKSIQQREILSLKELCARRAMKELRQTTLTIHTRFLREHLPSLSRAKEIIMQCTQCPFCHGYFLNTWLECVEFIDIRRAFPNMTKHVEFTRALIPQRALLCSYECFNSSGQDYFGAAFG